MRQGPARRVCRAQLPDQLPDGGARHPGTRRRHSRMSLINDALKQARKAPPRNTPSALPPLRPVADEPSPVAVWLAPAIVILLIVAAIFFIGWAVAHHTVRTIVATPDEATTTQATEVILPVVTPRQVEPPPPLNPPDAPK